MSIRPVPQDLDTGHLFREEPESTLAWIVLGAIAGGLAGLLVRGDEGIGIVGHIVLGISARWSVASSPA